MLSSLIIVTLTQIVTPFFSHKVPKQSNIPKLSPLFWSHENVTIWKLYSIRIHNFYPEILTFHFFRQNFFLAKHADIKNYVVNFRFHIYSREYESDNNYGTVLKISLKSFALIE